MLPCFRGNIDLCYRLIHCLRLFVVVYKLVSSVVDIAMCPNFMHIHCTCMCCTCISQTMAGVRLNMHVYTPIMHKHTHHIVQV